MSAAYDLDRADEPFPGPAQPQVLSRAFTVPPGAPWEQARAAQLEVRHGSPLPISDLMWRLRRIGGWRPGAPGRYAVFYIRSREYAAPFEAALEVDGVTLRVGFGLASDQLRQARRATVLVAALAACVAPLAVGGLAAWHTRAAAAAALDNLDRTVQAKARLATRVQRERAQDRELRGAVGQGERADQVIGDLTWLSAAKIPDSRIQAIHWDHGLLAVEARGEAPPLEVAGRALERSARPVRPGVWLWGVRASPPAAGRP